MRTIFEVKHNKAVLNCRMQGSGPVLLMIHGVACDGYYYDEAAKCLEDSFTVITYDRRGYSDSRADSDADMSIEAQAEDAVAILDAKNVEQAYICGSSAGALIAIEVLRKYPERIKAMFLHEPPLGVAEPFSEQILAWLIDLNAAAKAKKYMSAMLIFIKKLGGTDAEAAPTTRMEQNFENLKVFLELEAESFLHYGERLPKGHLRYEGIPVTLVAGEDDLEGLFSQASESIAEYLKCAYYRVPGYHNLPYDRPAIYAGEVKKAFLK